MARLFVAVWPPAAVLDPIAALPRPEVRGLRWTTPHQWHVTLRFLGPVDDPGTAVAALSDLAVGATEAVVGPQVARFGSRVLHVPVAGLEEAARAVVAATAGLGRPPEDRPFVGHLTLARAAARPAVDLRPLTGTAVTGRWPVAEVSLVESRLSATGPRYRVIATVPLGGRGGG